MTTQHPAPPADTEYPADTAVVARRAVGLIVDVAVLTAVGYVVAALLELAFDDPAYGGMSPTGHILAIVLGVGLWLAAFVGVPVSTGGQTLGMRLTGVRAVRADGSAASGVDHLVRMVCLIVDGLLAGLVGLGVILASQRRQRIGDMAAGTLVVRS